MGLRPHALHWKNIMTQQTIDEYRLKWLTKQVFRVKVRSANEEHFSWITDNVNEKSVTHAFNAGAYDNGEYTFMFENAIDADAFREKFLGDSRTVDVG